MYSPRVHRNLQANLEASPANAKPKILKELAKQSQPNINTQYSMT
jgi:hypothetical protein